MINLNVEKHKQHDSAIVIGGSLSGLMTAIALSEQGIRVTVLEKAEEGSRTGAGLQVDGDSFNQTKIEEKLKQIVSGGKNSVELWTSIDSRLREQAHKDPNIDLYFNTRVVSIDQNEQSAWAETEQGKLFEGDILIGADGHRSIVREKVAPEHPHAKFAGYIVWMASIAEEELPKDKIPELHGQDVEMLNTIGGFSFGSVIKDENDITRIGCTWYDNTQTDLLNRLGAVKGKFVHHSVNGSDIAKDDLDVLAEHAKTRWSEPWLTATLHAIYSRNFIGIPVKEYVPERLVEGRFAIIGDAAHVPAPITANGFNESLKDAAVLSECASDGLKRFRAYDTLQNYESRRLTKVQEMVKSGRWFSESFGRY